MPSPRPAPGVHPQTMIAISSTKMQIALHSMKTKFFPNYYFFFSLLRAFVSFAHFVSFTRIDPNASIEHYDSFQITYGIPYAGTMAKHFHFSLFHDPRRFSATQCNENSISVITSIFFVSLSLSVALSLLEFFFVTLKSHFVAVFGAIESFWRASIHYGGTSEWKKSMPLFFLLSVDGSTLFFFLFHLNCSPAM